MLSGWSRWKRPEPQPSSTAPHKTCDPKGLPDQQEEATGTVFRRRPSMELLRACQSCSLGHELRWGVVLHVLAAKTPEWKAATEKRVNARLATMMMVGSMLLERLMSVLVVPYLSFICCACSPQDSLPSPNDRHGRAYCHCHYSLNSSYSVRWYSIIQESVLWAMHFVLPSHRSRLRKPYRIVGWRSECPGFGIHD